MSPFGKFVDFADCVNKNQDKKNPEAYCAYLHHQITGHWPAQKNFNPKLPDTLQCPVCNNPVNVNKANAHIKCPKCHRNLVAVKIRRVIRK